MVVREGHNSEKVPVPEMHIIHRSDYQHRKVSERFFIL